MNWVIAFATLIAGVQGFAMGPSPADTPKGHKIHYKSWCQGERVMTTDRDGQIFAAWDCSEISDYSRCVELAEKDSGWTIVTATCQKNRNALNYKPMFCETYEDYEDCPKPEPGPDDIDDGDGGRTGPGDPGGEF